MPIWDHLDSCQYIGLHPWVWIQLESAEPPGPFPFMGGVAPEVVASLHEVHSILLSSVETAISDVFARRASLDDPSLRERLEDAYAEVVRSRPRLQAHITCGRNPDGTFHWEFPQDRHKSATITYGGLRIFNAVKRAAVLTARWLQWWEDFWDFWMEPEPFRKFALLPRPPAVSWRTT